jgi:uncharacterized membrane protein YgdD (TMEM256/DUF423 family)
MQPDVFRLRISAFTGFLAILLGAMGAHGPLHERLKAAGELSHWETAVQYHLPHAVVLLLLALLSDPSAGAMRWAWRMILAGILLFSGSLYVLAFTGVKWLGAITPVGGLSLMIGWLLTGFSARRK